MMENIRVKAINAHIMVAELAIAMAKDFWENASSNNEFHMMNPYMNVWVKQFAGMFIDDSRWALLQVIADPTTSQSDKIRIKDALELDEKLPASMDRVETATKDAMKIEKIKQHAFATMR